MTRLRLGEPLAPEALRALSRTWQLQHFKWDTQVGDVGVLFSQRLLIARGEWDRLCGKAERAARELIALERLVAADPALQRKVGIPARLRRFLTPDAAAVGPRVWRFDFHPTAEGWSVSEVNADVPGGFGEASTLPALFAPFCAGAVPPPCPLTAWGEAVAAAVPPGDAAVMYAPGHLEDAQVALILGRELGRRGFVPHLIQSPAALRWENGDAHLVGAGNSWLALVVRFYQAEWLTALPGRTGWRELFGRPAATCVLPPPAGVVSESKRLPLLFDAAGPAAETLRALFPASCDPRDVDPAEREEWVLKAAYANNGDEVHCGADLSAETWRQRLRHACRDRRAWVVQRRFETLALPSAAGFPVRPCVGVYVVGHRAAGAYVRLSRQQVTDARAFEAPLFIVPDDQWA